MIHFIWPWLFLLLPLPVLLKRWLPAPSSAARHGERSEGG